MAARFAKLAIAATALLLCIGSRSAAAQIATDGTTGPRMQLHGPEFAIGAELGTRAGRNLFHSFERFSLATGERATFSGPAAIRNIITRVTGGARSDIDGTIASTIRGADFYFLNPAGVMFGPDARLDVQGSFHVSSADEVRFADGATFSATNPAASSFTVVPPEAFGFLGAVPAAISVDSAALAVPEGESLSLVGGELAIASPRAPFTSNLRASGGRIELVSAAAPGAVAVGPHALASAPVARFGPIRLSDFARLDTSGNGGGSVHIRGGEFVVTGGASIFADNTGPSNASGGIALDAEAVTIDSASRLTTDVFGAGRGGALAIAAKRVDLGGGAVVGSTVFGAGGGGALTISARRALVVSGPGSAVQAVTRAFSTGAGGPVTIRAPRVALGDGGAVSASPAGSGAGGDVLLEVGRLTISGGGAIRTATSGPGAAGDLVVIADGAIAVRDEGSAMFSGTFSSGAAGDLRLDSPRLEVEGGFVSTGSARAAAGAVGDLVIEVGKLNLTHATLSTSSLDLGPAGDMTIAARDGIIIRDSSVNAFSLSPEPAGSIVISAPVLEISGDSLMSTATFTPTGFDPGAAGDITIDVDRLTLNGGARIATTTLLFGASSGGALTVTAREAVLIAGRQPNGIPSGLEAASFGSGPGGRVVVTTPRLEMRDGGEIDAAARVDGNGGDVVIDAGSVLLSGGALITARTTGQGNAGRIDLVAERLVIEGRGSGIVSSSAVTDAPEPPDRLGNAGSIAITSDRLTLRAGGQISSTADREGGAGGITLVVADRLETDRGTISTDSAAAGGGQIELKVTDVIVLGDSAITTSVAGGTDPTAGDISVDPKILVIDHSQIHADASRGFGGKVRIVADSVLVPGGDFETLIRRGDISATGGTPERAGSVAVNSPEVDLSSGLVVLEGALLDATSQLRARCGARRDIGASSFTGVGRGGLPPGPDGPLASAYVDQAAVLEAQASRPTTAPAADLRRADPSAPCVPLE